MTGCLMQTAGGGGKGGYGQRISSISLRRGDKRKTNRPPPQRRRGRLGAKEHGRSTRHRITAHSFRIATYHVIPAGLVDEAHLFLARSLSYLSQTRT